MTRRAYRIGAHHGVTIIEYDPDEVADDQGRRPADRLIAMAVSRHDAARMVRALNAEVPR